MNAVPVKELQPIPTLPYHLFHESGTLLHAAGEPLEEEHLKLMEKLGILIVMIANPKDSQLSFKIKSLKGYYNETIYIKKSDKELNLDQVNQYKQRLEIQTRLDRPPVIEIKLDEKKLIRYPTRQLDPQRLDQINTPQQATVKPIGEGLRKHIRKRPAKRAKLHVDEFIGLHHDAVTQMRKIFAIVRDQQNIADISGELIGDIAQRSIKGLLQDKDLLLNLIYLKTIDDYLVGHSVNVCLLSIQIATSMGYSPDQVLEVAYGALLQDIGMTRVPLKILNKKGKLTYPERLEIQRHPIYSLEILQRVKGIPESIAWIAYHSHERLDGSGYSKHRTKSYIHQFAKIVSVADVYEALISPRSYRDAKLPYLAMEEVIRMGHKKKLDPEVIKALLKYICLFPIGSWVELSNGSIGKVVAANETLYDRPIVCVFYNAGKKKFTSPFEINLAEESKLRVSKALDAKDLKEEFMEGFQ